MRMIIKYISSCFCNHEWEMMSDATVTDDFDDSFGSKVYRCKKCGYSKIQKLLIERSDNVTRNDKNNLVNLLKQAQDTINHMASDLNEHDLDCYYCAHFPEGGDGKCPMYSNDGSNGWCHFRWRFADEIDNAVGKLRLDQIRELELKIRDHEEENKKEDEQLS